MTTYDDWKAKEFSKLFKDHYLDTQQERVRNTIVGVTMPMAVSLPESKVSRQGLFGKRDTSTTAPAPDIAKQIKPR